MSAITEDAAPVASPGPEAAVFGHPVGLFYILGIEACWYFAYYGVQNMLTLYLTQRLFMPGHVEHVIGLAGYKAGLAHLGGPISAIGLASQTFGFVTFLAYALPLAGGLIADRWMGQKRAVLAGVVVGTAALLLMVSEAGFLIGLGLFVIGAGLMKCNVLVQTGRLYPTGDARRSVAFAYYLIAINVGGLLTPLISGTLAERIDWRWGFASLTLGGAGALLCCVAGLKHMPADTARRGAGEAVAPKLARGDRGRIAALLLTMTPTVLFFSAYNQAFNIFPVWAKAHLDLTLGGFVMPVTWFNTLDGILTIVGAALAIRLWSAQASAGRPLREFSRIAVGCGLAALAFGSLALGATGEGKAPFLCAVGFFVLVDPAITWVQTVTMSLVSRASPPAVATVMMGAFAMSVAVANLAVGEVGGFYDSMAPAAFWAINAGIAAAALLFLALAGRPLARVLASPDQARA